MQFACLACKDTGIITYTMPCLDTNGLATLGGFPTQIHCYCEKGQKLFSWTTKALAPVKET